ncbi:AAA-ATPase At3g28540-like [Papaver somniferum]|uniref:AAA-ATPase At3g28540-like n=1 Tax=Papaver somniferum TaxID=3469 RepID=UPI000E6F8D1F|nr:AAA-ATPase At3g28540-like [Papaver somniferum]
MDLEMDLKSLDTVYGTLMFLRPAFQELLPPYVRKFIRDIFYWLLPYIRKEKFTIDIDGGCYGTDGFSDVQTYLSSKCFDSINHMKTTTIGKPNKTNYTIAPDGIVTDTYKDIAFTWILKEEKSDETSYYVTKIKIYFQLCAQQKYKTFMHESYLPYIKKQVKRVQFENRGKYIYTNRSESDESWTRVSRFKHPSKFGAIAIDPVLKQELKSDLDKFVGRKKYYTRVGRSWKRGYLLYGPPGTGKTSLIDAVANYLKFDIYDMELTAVKTNSHLRNLLIATKSKSVIVIEDIDCSQDFSSREKENTNDDDNDKGRSSRADKEKKKKVLAKNYLQIQKHEIMNEVKELLKFVRITPADVAEFLMSCDDDADIGLGNLVKELKRRLELMNKEDTIDQNKKEAATIQEKEEVHSENMNLKGCNDAKEC